MRFFCTILGILITMTGICAVFKPGRTWELTERWKSYNREEPSAPYEFSVRFGGALFLVFGVFFLFLDCPEGGLVCVTAGLFFVLKPDVMWKLKERWKYEREDEPSDLYLFWVKLKGIFYILTGMFFVIYSLFAK